MNPTQDHLPTFQPTPLPTPSPTPNPTPLPMAEAEAEAAEVEPDPADEELADEKTEETTPGSTAAAIKSKTPKAALQPLDTAAVPQLALQHDLQRLEDAALAGDIGEQ